MSVSIIYLAVSLHPLGDRGFVYVSKPIDRTPLIRDGMDVVHAKGQMEFDYLPLARYVFRNIRYEITTCEQPGGRRRMSRHSAKVKDGARRDPVASAAGLPLVLRRVIDPDGAARADCATPAE